MRSGAGYPSLRILGIVLLLAACDGPILRDLSLSASGLSVADAALRGGSAPVALDVVNRVLAKSPDNAAALEIQGDALTALGPYDAATVAFEHALREDPSSVRARVGLGRLRLRTNPEEAERLFLEVHMRNPRDTIALNNLGIARDLQGHHADAQMAYRQALGIDPDLNAAQINLALSLASERASAVPVRRKGGRTATAPMAPPGQPLSLIPQ